MCVSAEMATKEPLPRAPRQDGKESQLQHLHAPHAKGLETRAQSRSAAGKRADERNAQRGGGMLFGNQRAKTTPSYPRASGGRRGRLAAQNIDEVRSSLAP